MPYSGCHCTPRQKRRCGRLDRLDHAVGRAAADHHARADAAGRLVMRAVDLEPRAAAAEREQPGAGQDLDRMAGLGARVGLLVGEAARHGVGDVLDQVAAERDVEQLLAAADAEDRQVARERALW